MLQTNFEIELRNIGATKDDLVGWIDYTPVYDNKNIDMLNLCERADNRSNNEECHSLYIENLPQVLKDSKLKNMNLKDAIFESIFPDRYVSSEKDRENFPHCFYGIKPNSVFTLPLVHMYLPQHRNPKKLKIEGYKGTDGILLRLTGFRKLKLNENEKGLKYTRKLVFGVLENELLYGYNFKNS